MKIIKYLLVLLIVFFGTKSFSNEVSFDTWLINFKDYALKKNISEKTFDVVMGKVKFLPQVIKYDRFQPEFYENTFTYIKKRTSKKKVKKGIELYKSNKIFIDLIEDKFEVEKELLLALMGIETNFGTYLGKMDIISCLATLSFDKRRSDFFTNELITILKLVENKTVDPNILYGSWAGAFGNFQFMPSTIEKYAIDYNSNNLIELKEIKDSFASAANYINKIGWQINEPCFMPIILSKEIPIRYLNTSAKKIKNKKKLKFFKKYIKNLKLDKTYDEKIVGIITPDKDIIPEANNLKPAFIVFENYDLVLKWNRSLRFALAVCTLKNNFKNVL